jgi:hypothetical protein
MTPEEIAELFRVMEEDLFKSMARNMRRHEAWEEEEGFTWVQWQAEQINGLRAFREEIQDIVNATYNRATPEMERMLTDAYHYAGERAVVELRRNTRRNVSQQFFGVTPKMRRMIETVLNDVNQTRYAAINRMNSGYTSIIQQADILAQSGTMTIQQAVDRASAQFVGAGLNCVEYRNGNRVGIDSYVEMALRTSSRDAAAVAEGEKRNEWEEYLVISNVINTTCPHCMRWQGKVLVDDVYADGKPDGKHPLLSTAKADGFLHPNCRHKPRTYIPDVTRIPDQPEKAKTREQYEAEQKQRYYERNIRKYKRLRECSLDDENRAYYDRKVNEWSDALNEHLGDNPSLRGNAWRTGTRGIKRSDVPNVVNVEEPPLFNQPRLVQPNYIDASSIEEAQSIASNYVEKRFMDRTFNGVVDFKGISLENANEINRALQNVFENFPDMEKLSGIKVVDPKSRIGQKAFKDGADALFSYDPIQHGIYVNRDILKSRATFEVYMAKSDEAWRIVMDNIDSLSGLQREVALRYQQAGRSTVGDTIQDLFTHELGHHIQWTTFDAKTVNNLSSEITTYAGRISGYASASNGEYIAESFVAYMRGERDILSPNFVEILDKSLNSVANNGGGDIQFIIRGLDSIPPLILPKEEFAHVMSEISTHMPRERFEERIGSWVVDDYVYLFTMDGFENIKIIGKEHI